MPAHNPLVPRLPSYGEAKTAVRKVIAGMQPPPPPETFRDSGTDNDPAEIPTTEETEYPPHFAYRGVETHGVPPTASDDANPYGYTDGTVGVVYDDNSTPDPVVNVRVIRDSKEELKAFRATQSAVDGTPRMVVNRHRQRTALKIRHLGNTGDSRIWIGNDNAVSPTNGYPLDPGGELAMTSTEAVWMIANVPAAVVPIAIFTDFVQDI